MVNFPCHIFLATSIHHSYSVHGVNYNDLTASFYWSRGHHPKWSQISWLKYCIYTCIIVYIYFYTPHTLTHTHIYIYNSDLSHFTPSWGCRIWQHPHSTKNRLSRLISRRLKLESLLVSKKGWWRKQLEERLVVSTGDVFRPGSVPSSKL
jgi:hypothetical protein